MSDVFSYFGLAAVWGSIISFIFLFFYFGANKEKYNKIIELYYKNGLSFYVPYHFHTLTGFFGSFTLVYYFLCLLKNKKPVFMYYKNENVYRFFDDIPSSLYSWMNLYYKVTLVCIAFCSFFY